MHFYGSQQFSLELKLHFFCFISLFYWFFKEFIFKQIHSIVKQECLLKLVYLKQFFACNRILISRIMRKLEATIILNLDNDKIPLFVFLMLIFLMIFSRLKHLKYIIGIMPKQYANSIKFYLTKSFIFYFDLKKFKISSCHSFSF